MTEAEYQKRLQELYDNQSKSEQLVKDMAERYVSTDYDQLDEFDRQVQMFIEEGELQKADSMIHSKGSFKERVANIQKSENVNKQREKEIRIEQEDLAKSKLFTAKEKESLSTDLYRASVIAQQQYQWEEAISCLKMRSELDTTNFYWNLDVANILSQQCFWLQSFDYYERTLRHVQGYLAKTSVLNHYGYALLRHGDKDKAREMYLATELCDPRLNPNDNRYSDYALAFHYTNMAVSSRDNEEMGKYAKLALELYRKLGDSPEIARNCNNVGAYYINKGDLQKGIDYYLEAYSIDKVLHNVDPSNDSFLSSLAWMERLLGEMYLQIDSTLEAKNFLYESRSHYEILAKKDLNQYRVHLVEVDWALGKLYSVLSLNDSVASCRERLNENFKILYERDPEKYIENYYNNLSSLMHLQGNTDECIKFSKEILANYETPSGKLLYSANNVPHTLRADLRAHAINDKEILDFDYFTKRVERLCITDSLVAVDDDWYMLGDAYYDLYMLYNAIGDLRTSAKYGELSLQVYMRMTKNIVPFANMCREMMLLYAQIDEIELFVQRLETAIRLYTNLYSSSPSSPGFIDLQNMKVIHLMGYEKIDEATELAEKTYVMDESNPQSKALLAECYKFKAHEYANSSDFINAITFIDKAISMSPFYEEYYDSKGEFLLMQGKNKEALAMWEKVMELNPNFLKDNYPNGTELSNGLKKLGLIE